MLKVLLRFSSVEKIRELNKSFNFAKSVSLFQKEFPSTTDETEKKQMTYEYLKALSYIQLSSDDMRGFKPPEFQQKEHYQFLSSLSFHLRSIFTLSFLTASGLFLITNVLSDNKSSLFNLEQPIKEAESSSKTFEDVKGIDEYREELQDVVDYLKDPAKYKAAGAKMHKGILLTGEPGTGKTLLAKAIAGEAGVKFLYTSGSEFDEMFLGLGALRVRRLFEVARQNAPCIIFIDEIDSMAGKRQSGDSSGSQTLNQLLIEIDGFNSNDEVIIIAATNLPQSIDPALKRSGRFDKEIRITLPSLKGRLEILQLYLAKVKHDPDLKLDWISKKTVGMTGADLANLVNIAAINAGKYNRGQIENSDFDYAIDRVTIGIERPSYKMSRTDIMNTAYHELGHAYIGYIKGVVDLHKITILPRGHSLGHTAYLPQKQHDLLTIREIEAYISTALAGRAAEEVFMGKDNVTTGCASDLKKSTSFTFMGLRSGLFFNESQRLGVNSSSLGEAEHAYLENVAQKVCSELYKDVVRIIRENKDMLHALAGVLVENETITAEEFKGFIDNYKG